MKPVRLAILMFLMVFLCAASSVDAKSTFGLGQNASSANALSAPIDLNSASQQELEKLPGIGAANAKKIIAGRPYNSTAELSKSGIPAKTMTKITPMVTVGKSSVPAAAKVPAATAAPSVTPAKTALTPAAAEKTVTPVPAPAEKDMVWVNSESKVYHKSSSRWFGKTKKGSYMKESEAISAGYREIKN